jgi:SOS-response transcriptional repressor LexA
VKVLLKRGQSPNVCTVLGNELRLMREQRGVKASWMATRLGLKHRQQLHKIESKKDVSVDEFVAYTTALGLKPGDLLENSGGVRSELRPLVDQLEAMNPAAIAHARDLLRVADAIALTAAPKEADNVVPFRPRAPQEMSDDAMERLTAVMREAGAEPRKGALGPEREVRFYGLAGAGDGIEFIDDIPEEYRQIPQWAWKKGARGVFKAAGESMMDVGIFPDDIMFVKPTPEPANGAIVICRRNRMVYVKRLKRDTRGVPVQLISKNPAYAPIDIKPDDEIEFFGEVVGRTGGL